MVLLRSAVGMTHDLRSDLWWTTPLRILLGQILGCLHFGESLVVRLYSEIDNIHLSSEAQCVSHLYPLVDCHWSVTSNDNPVHVSTMLGNIVGKAKPQTKTEQWKRHDFSSVFAIFKVIGFVDFFPISQKLASLSRALPKQSDKINYNDWVFFQPLLENHWLKCQFT